MLCNTLGRLCPASACIMSLYMYNISPLIMSGATLSWLAGHYMPALEGWYTSGTLHSQVSRGISNRQGKASSVSTRCERGSAGRRLPPYSWVSCLRALQAKRSGQKLQILLETKSPPKASGEIPIIHTAHQPQAPSTLVRCICDSQASFATPATVPPMTAVVRLA